MIRVAASCANHLGEGVVWDAARQRLLWLDLMAPALFRLSPGDHRAEGWPLPLRPPSGPVVPTDRPDTLVVADRNGMGLLDERIGQVSPWLQPERGRPDLQINDGKVDRWGRLWLGTSDAAEAEPRGALWCIAPEAEPVLADTGFVVSNGPAFSPDGTTLYFSDSVAGRILAYTVSPDDPWPRGRRVLATMGSDEGLPDGLTVDAEGGVWVAQWDGWRVTRFAPDGTRLQRLDLPVPRVTSVAFGGEDLSTLFITTARLDLSPSDLERAPDSGHLFAAEVGVKGLEERVFALGRGPRLRTGTGS